jgi:hypothetical protein
MTSPATRTPDTSLGRSSNYDEMHVQVLRDEWRRRGLKNHGHTKKIDLIRGLQDDDNGRKPNARYEEKSFTDLRTQCQARGLPFMAAMQKEELITLLEDDDQEEREAAHYIAMSKHDARRLATERGIAGVNYKSRKSSLVKLLRQWDRLQETADSEQDTEAPQTPFQKELPFTPNARSVNGQNESSSQFKQNEPMAAPSDTVEDHETQELVDEPSWSTLDSLLLPRVFSTVGEQGILYDLELFLTKTDNTRIAGSNKNTTYSSTFRSTVHNILGDDPFSNLLNPAIIWDLPHLHFAMITVLDHEDERFKLIWPRLYCGGSWKGLIGEPLGSSSHEDDPLCGGALRLHPLVAAIMPQEAIYQQLVNKIKNFRNSQWGQQVWTRLKKEVEARLLAMGQDPSAFPHLQLKVAEHYLISARVGDSKIAEVAGIWWTVQLVQDLHQDGSVIKTCVVNIPGHYGWDRVSLALQESSNSVFSHQIGYPHGYTLKHGHWNYQVDIGYWGASLKKMHKISAPGFLELRQLMLAGKSRPELLIWHDVQIKVARERRESTRKLFEAANRTTPSEWGIKPGVVAGDIAYEVDNGNPWAAFGITPGEPWPEDVRRAMYEYDQSGAGLSRRLNPDNAPEPLADDNGDADATLPNPKDLDAPLEEIPLASGDNADSSLIPGSNGAAARMEQAYDEAVVDVVFGQRVDLDTWKSLTN